MKVRSGISNKSPCLNFKLGPSDRLLFRSLCAPSILSNPIMVLSKFPFFHETFVPAKALLVDSLWGARPETLHLRCPHLGPMESIGASGSVFVRFMLVAIVI